jgi:ABC-type glycerol-3-phosphate transport system substrate-binding protein
MLYQDGLLDQEWATSSGDDVMAAASKGMVGCILSGHWLGNGQLLQIEREVDPTQDWVQIYPPPGLKDKPGTGRILGCIPGDRAIAMFSWANCPEALVAFADWSNASFENFMLCRFGIEGKHWKYGDNGCFIDMRTDPPNQEYSGGRATIAARKWSTQFALLPPQPGNEPKDPLVNKRVLGPHFYNRPDTTKPQQGEYPMLVPIEHLVPWRFTESAKFEPDFLSMRDEHVTRIVKGEISVQDGIKAFWDAWFPAGGEIRLREVRDQYDAYIAAHPEMADPRIFFSPENWNTQIQYPERKAT